MNMKNTSLKLSTIALAVALASCGGGGGFYGESSNGSGTGSGTATGNAAVNTSTVQLLDSSGKQVTVVTAAGATAKVKVTDSSGKGISGALVTFTAGGLTFGTTNNAVVTNADGEAMISVKPTNVSDTGSYQISATATFAGNTATTAALSFSLQAANITFANFAVESTAIASGGTTNVTLKTIDADSGSNQNNITVNFTTSCGTFEPATVVSSNQGDVTTTYKAIDAAGNLCANSQTITATSGSVTRIATVNVASVEANSMVYTTTSDTKLGIRSSGSGSTGQIEFTVFSNGSPAANQDVILDLVRAPSDLSFVSLNNRTSRTVKSNSTGKVVVNLYPGNLPGPVEVKATLASDSSVAALSKNVAVQTGRAYQNGLSISVSKNSLQGDKDGDTSTITARLVDRVGNPVPDGTVVSFIAEGGSISPNCATKDGECSVDLKTQNPRPTDDRVSVVAFLEGDKTYTDINSDGVFTQGTDTLASNIGDFFRDDNENNQFDAGEFKYTKGVSGATCVASSISQPNITGTCDTGLDAILRQQLLFAFASDTPTFVGISGVDAALTAITNLNNFSFQVFGNSALTVPMPSGTTVGVSAKDNTEYKPVARLNSTATTLNVTAAQPNSNLSVTVGSQDVNVVINGSGTGSTTINGAASTDAITVNYTNTTCEAEVLSGNLTVPDRINLLTPSTFRNTSNSAVRYSVRLKGCLVQDDVRISVQAPDTLTTRIITL